MSVVLALCSQLQLRLALDNEQPARFSGRPAGYSFAVPSEEHRDRRTGTPRKDRTSRKSVPDLRERAPHPTKAGLVPLPVPHVRIPAFSCLPVRALPASNHRRRPRRPARRIGSRCRNPSSSRTGKKSSPR